MTTSASLECGGRSTRTIRDDAWIGIWNIDSGSVSVEARVPGKEWKGMSGGPVSKSA